MPDHSNYLAEEEVRRRSFEISLRADAGSPEENWLRAVDELRKRTRRRCDPPAGRAAFPPNTSALTHP